MRLERVKNAKRGIAFGLIGRIVGLFLAFLVQSITIRKLGIDYVGIKGLFSSILSVLSLAELGVGSAIVYAMYKPIAEDDIETICALMNLYKKIYRIIGSVILLLGLLVIPFLDDLINGTYPPEINIKVVYLLYLGSTVLSYWLFAYKSCLLTAFQRNDVSSIIGTISTVLTSIVQILVLIIFENFYVFLIVSLFGIIINNIIISKTVDRMYPELKCRGNVDRDKLNDIKKKVYGLLIGKICGVTRNSFDSIFMSAFLGLTQAAIYSNYYLIIASCNSFIYVALGSLMAGVGNSIALNSKEKNYQEMMLLNNIYLVISGAAAAFMVCLYQPFMKLWAGAEYVFPEYTMILFPMYFYITKMGDIRGIYADGAGLFWEDRWRSILEAIGNIILNYVLGKAWGAFGIVLATLISLFCIGFIGSSVVIFKHYFTNGLKKYFFNQGILLFIALGIGGTSYLLCQLINPENMVISIMIRTMICIAIIPTIYWVLLHGTKEYTEAKIFLHNIIKLKKGKLAS